MPEKPKISPGTWIRVGRDGADRAVVAMVHDGQFSDCLVVYNDPIREPKYRAVRWADTHWDFVSTSGGSSAKGIARLRSFVEQLRAGRPDD